MRIQTTRLTFPLLTSFPRNERTTEAIVLHDSLIDSKRHTFCLAATGEILAVLPTNIFFSVPNIVSLDLVARCGIEAVPETPQAINARVEALKLLRVVSVQAQQASQGSRMWERQSTLNIYNEVKNPDPTKWAEVTLDHATGLFYVLPGYVNYYATHKYLMERPLKYIAETGYIRSQIFRVRPERDVQEIQTVENWITKYRVKPRGKTPYKLFIEKARRAVAEYNELPIRKTGPMAQEKAGFNWTEDDKVILSYLLRSLQQHMTSQLDPYRVGRSVIVKDILSGIEVSDNVIHELLIKLCVIAPWQDLHALSPLLNPAGDFGVEFPVEKEIERIYRASARPQPVSGLVLGPYDLVPSDPLDSVRHDFGNQKVYVIDDPTAAELDDGISLERIPSEPDNHWVHVHIADPVRHLHPRHALSFAARKQFTSIYLATANFPMLPTGFTHDPAYGLSLVDSSGRTEPNYALTFSIKLDGKANILDYKLRASILRNVCKTTYRDVDTVLGEIIPTKKYPFGGAPRVVPHHTTLSEEDAADLRILKKLAQDQVKKRAFEQRIVNLDSVAARVEVEAPPRTGIQSPCLSGSVYHGFPKMTYAVSSVAEDDRGARNLVSEAMKLACRVASRVGLDHNVPLIRRSVQPFVWADNDFDSVFKLTNGTGFIPHQDFIRVGAFATSGQYMQEPGLHATLGLAAGEGYVRVTSPLRRYMDMVMHWQMHHILLGPNAPARPPFSSEDIDKLIVEAGIQDVHHRRLQNANMYFYSMMFIKRFVEQAAKHGPDVHNPLKTMKAWSLRTPRRDVSNTLSVPVIIPELGIQAQAIGLPSHFGDLQPGSDILVKLESIDLGLRRTKMYVTLV